MFCPFLALFCLIVYMYHVLSFVTSKNVKVSTYKFKNNYFGSIFLMFSFIFIFSLLKSMFSVERILNCSSKWFKYSFFFILLMLADSLFLIILIFLFVLLVSSMFALGDLKEDCNSVLSKVYMLVVLFLCTIAGWGLIDSLLSIGMRTLLKMGFVICGV